MIGLHPEQYFVFHIKNTLKIGNGVLVVALPNAASSAFSYQHPLQK